ncbi:MAG: S-layer homology domain-containing protein, partial [Syntrophomonadaceae bacterium]|nr:S-layer homology domain-containing protein [Syntrophomonadaceae bacterium]
MNKNARRLMIVFLSILLVVCSSVPALASNNHKNSNKDNNKEYPSCFKDVNVNHWAYKYIMWMRNKDIVHGIGNDMFNPNGTVTRAEFAKMMVRTLDIDIYSPSKPTFDDVNKKNWEYPYVESSKNYLTYYKTSTGNYFKSLEPSVREDMAVALVKALGYQNEDVDLDILDQFADASEITPSLIKYVALSVEFGLMKGYPKDGKLYFGPMGNLTRAEASTLLYRAFVVKEEKVPFDEDKLPYEEEIEEVFIKPVVTVIRYDDKLEVNWNKIDSPKFQGYKVVISKKDSTPIYPDNGYLYNITDKNQTSAIIDNSTPYNGESDFGEYLEKGERYYISVTAVYSDRKVAGNVVYRTYPGEDYVDYSRIPTVTISNENGVPVLRWTKTKSEGFKEYRVVISKGNSTPGIDDGYLYKIKDLNTTHAKINNTQKYTDGDFGNYLTKGERYYFTVVTVFEDMAVEGKEVRFRYDGNENPEFYQKTVVSAVYEDGDLVIKWDKIDSPILLEYRLVISKDNPAPEYPADGYYNTAYLPDTTSVAIDPSKNYRNGDFSKLKYGQDYYFIVTAVYKDG